MKSDELKDKWFNAYPEIMGIEGTEPTKCYCKADVDAAIAKLKDENMTISNFAMNVTRNLRSLSNEER